MRILGISALYHDSAAAIVIDGHIVAAAQEERFSRKKHDSSIPCQSISYCLSAAGITLAEIDAVVFYEMPLLKFDRIMKTHLMFAPKGLTTFELAAPLWVTKKLFHRRLIRNSLKTVDPSHSANTPILFIEHHLSHAASAFYPSPFEEALVLVMDGVGEWATTSVWYGQGNRLDIIKEIRFPHSLGLLYSAFSSYIGFRVNSGEYKLMGLAPYGIPRYSAKIFKHLIDLKPDGSYKIDLDYLNFCVGHTMTNELFHELFGMRPREPHEPLMQEHMDIAASIQLVIDEVVLTLTRHLATEFGKDNLCMAGGVALNCVTNGKILRDGTFRNLWIQPASGDAGGALGAALAGYHSVYGQPRKRLNTTDSMQGSYLGPEFSEDELQTRLSAVGARFSCVSDDELLASTVSSLERGEAVGWFQGRMEFGPRALGARSILADPRSPAMQSILNQKVKYRESFRPFAPAVLRERVSDYFDLDVDSPYMLLVAEVSKKRRRTVNVSAKIPAGLAQLNVLRSEIPAVTHVDHSARIQTVHSETNPRFHSLLHAFEQRTGCAALVNTSFNVRGEPIVCTPEDAFRCFMGTEIESLAIGNCFLRKDDQNTRLRLHYKSAFEPD